MARCSNSLSCSMAEKNSIDCGNNYAATGSKASLTASAFTNAELDALVSQLLPLITTQAKKNNQVECKCSKRLEVLQTKYDRLLESVNGYKDQVEKWKKKLKPSSSMLMHLIKPGRRKKRNYV